MIKNVFEVESKVARKLTLLKIAIPVLFLASMVIMPVSLLLTGKTYFWAAMFTIIGGNTMYIVYEVTMCNYALYIANEQLHRDRS